MLNLFKLVKFITALSQPERIEGWGVSSRGSFTYLMEGSDRDSSKASNGPHSPPANPAPPSLFIPDTVFGPGQVGSHPHWTHLLVLFGGHACIQFIFLTGCHRNAFRLSPVATAIMSSAGILLRRCVMLLLSSCCHLTPQAGLSALLQSARTC